MSALGRHSRWGFVESGDEPEAGACTRVTSEAAPWTDKACAAPPLDANLPDASYPSQPRTSRLRSPFANSAQL